MIPLPVISILFKFDDESLNWLDTNLQKFVDHFYVVFPETGGIYLKRHHAFHKEFQKTPVSIQIANLLNSIGLTNFYTNLIIHKQIPRKNPIIENPHIDTPYANPLPCRLNILVRGDNESNMYWWNKTIHDADIENQSTPIGPRYQIKNREILKNPYYIEKNLSVINKSADFVRTDILHSIYRTGNERVLVSTEISHPWEEVYQKVKLYKENLNVL